MYLGMKKGGGMINILSDIYTRHIKKIFSRDKIEV
jgi:hypothetical protein